MDVGKLNKEMTKYCIESEVLPTEEIKGVDLDPKELHVIDDVL